VAPWQSPVAGWQGTAGVGADPRALCGFRANADADADADAQDATAQAAFMRLFDIRSALINRRTRMQVIPDANRILERWLARQAMRSLIASASNLSLTRETYLANLLTQAVPNSRST
jgi:hypothetical protein